ncbi:phage portal protein [Bacillus cereus group sp. TH152-1LC]|uniref:phage portal protein n=1 Tax=Bacillus cereus group sp. TH152-1LC TaxID=3018060 RepID=UPI0022E51AD2|nr:phage portal protein [Bacillus cereus group sp. TH152-1LC]MDA1678653.1 phage portal protein [Bacillus cereus group sp. TH152-1LC]
MALSDILKASEHKQRADDLEVRTQELTMRTQELESHAQELETQRTNVENELQQATMQTQELEKRNQELETQLYTNFNDVFKEYNNSIYPTAEKIIKLPVVGQCLDLLSGAIAQMPVYLYKRNKDGSRTEIEDDNRVKLLNTRPNKHTGAYQYKKQLVRDYLLHGGGYSSIEKINEDDFGFDVEELYYLPKSNMNIRTIKSGYKPIGAKFDITSDGDGTQTQNAPETLSEDKVLRVLKDSEDGFKGIGLLKTGKEIFRQALHEAQFVNGIYERGAFPSGILKTNARLSQISIDRLKDAWNDLYSGSSNNAKTPILEEGMDYKPLQHSPADMQLNESRKNTKSEICNLFGVPESLITTAANKYNSIEQNNLHLLKHTLAPIINAFEDGLNLSLLDETEQDEEYFFEFDVEELSRATEKERIESFVTGVNGAILTINEVRQKLGYDKVTGGDDLLMGLGKVAMNTKTGEKTVFNLGQNITTEDKPNAESEKPNRT